MKLFFHEFGKGPPLIIIHGLLGVSDNWVPTGKGLSDRFRVLIPDLRNHGRSPHSENFDLPALENDLLELMETNLLNSAILMGHSLGGKIAMCLALRHPQMVEKLIVEDISLRRNHTGNEHQQLIQILLDTKLSAFTTRQQAEQHLAGTITNPRMLQLALKNLYWEERGRLGWRPGLREISQHLPEIFASPQIPGIYTGPALFIRGGLSDYISDTDVEVIKKKFPAAVVRTIEHATHWVHTDAPGEFNGMISDFLSPHQ